MTVPELNIAAVGPVYDPLLIRHGLAIWDSDATRAMTMHLMPPNPSDASSRTDALMEASLLS